MGTQIPVWVDGRQVWFTGVRRRTTCDDLIRAALLSYDGLRSGLGDRCHEKYIVVERWREVERRLSGRAKILKVWESWEEEQKNIRLIIRRQDRRLPLKDYKTRRRRTRTIAVPWYIRMHRATTPPLRAAMSERAGHYLSESAERLSHVVTSQKKILANQTQRLAEKDEVIERHEAKIHAIRIQLDGENYVQETYLSSKFEEDPDSGLNQRDFCELKEAIGLYKNIAELNRRIEKEEELVNCLSSLLRLSSSLKDSDLGPGGHEMSVSLSGAAENFEDAIDATRIQVERAVELCETQQLVIKENERNFLEFDKVLEEKRLQLDKLCLDLAAVDSETEQLKNKITLLGKQPSEEIEEDFITSPSANDTTGSSKHETQRHVLSTLV